MKNQNGFTLIEMLMTLVFIFGAMGWCFNIAKIAMATDLPITGLFILRVVGIFILPLGAVIGYF